MGERVGDRSGPRHGRRGQRVRVHPGAGQPRGRIDGGAPHRVRAPVRRRTGHAQSARRRGLRPGGTGGGRAGVVDQTVWQVMEFTQISPPDAAAAAAARARQDTLTKPRGALGRLEDLSVWIASCQGHCPPTQFERARVVVFAGDHGVAQSGVSAYPPEVTAQMVANIDAGGATINALCAIAGASVRVADLSVDADALSERIGAHKVRRGSGDIAVQDALTEEETASALAAGQRIADEEVDGGADLLIAGDMGIGNTTAAAVLVAALTNAEPVAVVGFGSGIDDAGWARKTAVVRDALFRTRQVLPNPAAFQP